MRLGELLKAIRKLRGYTLLAVETETGISNAYLSQMENNKIKTPSAGFLFKLAKLYDVHYEVLMKAAGYIETTEDVSNRLLGLAFSKTGSLSPEEVEHVSQFVSFLRDSKPKKDSNNKNTLISVSNIHLELKKYADELINKAGLQRVTPIPSDAILEVTKLRKEGETDLYAVVEDIHKRTGNWIASGLQKILGMFDFTNKTVYVSPDIHQKKDRFVTFHEIAHQVIPWHKELFYADDQYNLSFEIDKKIEAEANELAAHLMFGADRFTQEAADYQLSLASAKNLADKYEASYHSAFRRYVETHQLPCALIIYKIERSETEFLTDKELSLEYQYVIKSKAFISGYDSILPDLINKKLNKLLREFSTEDLLANSEKIEGSTDIFDPLTSKTVELYYQGWGNYYNFFVLLYPRVKQSAKKIATFSD